MDLPVAKLQIGSFKRLSCEEEGFYRAQNAQRQTWICGLSVPLPLSLWRSIQSLWLLNESKMSKSLTNLQHLNKLKLTCGKGLTFKGPESFTCHGFEFTVPSDTNRLCDRNEPVYCK